MRKMMLLFCSACAKIRLLQAAIAGVGAARHRKDGLHAAVRRVRVRAAVRVGEEREARHQRRTVGRDERRQRIGRPRGDPCADHLEFGIIGRTAAADRRLRVASGAAIEIESRPKAIIDAARNNLLLLKAAEPVVEEFQDSSRSVRIHRGERQRAAWVAPGWPLIGPALTPGSVCASAGSGYVSDAKASATPAMARSFFIRLSLNCSPFF